ncbi:hypothetical protein ILYODFUR_023512 [Ilyodon furcidens]|uniref:Uncharacterized protein n=1 Tax=Ilyodon furcidens TaxID=33524 RepID=A0ABV0TL21_9TELE
MKSAEPRAATAAVRAMEMCRRRTMCETVENQNQIPGGWSLLPDLSGSFGVAAARATCDRALSACFCFEERVKVYGNMVHLSAARKRRLKAELEANRGMINKISSQATL